MIEGQTIRVVSPHVHGIARYLKRSGRRACINPVTRGIVIRHGKRYIEIVPRQVQEGGGV